MYRESGVSRVVGIPREEGKKEEEKEKDLLEVFKDQFEREVRHPLEQEHSAELQEAISQANQCLKEFMASYGVEWLDIPPRNIHIVDISGLDPTVHKKMKESNQNTKGRFISKEQQIFIYSDYNQGSKLKFFGTLIHEMLHANSFQSFQKTPEGKGVDELALSHEKEDGSQENLFLGMRRIGLNLINKEGNGFFHKIDEAIIEELNIRFFNDSYLDRIPALQDEVKLRQGVLEGTKDKEKFGRKIQHVSRESIPGSDQSTYHIYPFSYKDERKRLNGLIRDLFQKNQDRFASREDVFQLFVDACMKGRLLPLARLFEHTEGYGPGSFRKLGEETIQKRRSLEENKEEK